jgi:hypothetical protein
LTLKLPRDYASGTLCMLFSAPAMAKGAQYAVYTGGSISGGTEFHGVYTGAAYTRGTQAATFTAAAYATAGENGTGPSGSPGAGGQPGTPPGRR